MPVIDDRGRLFGRLNLIDAIVAVVALGLIPLAYAAFLLFRVPVPKITSVQPAQVTQGGPATLQITGEDLRPFLRAQIGTLSSMGFLVQSPTFAEVKVPDLPPGSYDLVLFDEAQELVRVPGALTVVAPAPPASPPPPPVLPSIELQVVGEFIGLGRLHARLIRPGLEFRRSDEPPTGEVLLVRSGGPGVHRLTVGPNATIAIPRPDEVRVPGIVRVRCVIVGEICQVGGVTLSPGATIMLPLPVSTDGAEAPSDRPDYVTFAVEQVRQATARVNFPALRIDVRAVGEFIGLTNHDAERIRVGVRFEGRRDEAAAEVLAVRAPEAGVLRVRVGSATVAVPAADEVQVPALIRVSCVIRSGGGCQVGDTVLAPSATIALPGPGTDGDPVRFMIRDVLPTTAPATSRSARADVHVVGEFFGLTQDDLLFVEVGSKFERWSDEPFAEVLAVRTPEPGSQRVRLGERSVWSQVDGELRVRAIVRMSCVITTTEECLVDDDVLAPDAAIRLPLPGRSEEVSFLITEVHSADTPAVFPTVSTAVATVRVRFVAGQEVLDVMNAGDVDLSGSTASADMDMERAILTQIGEDPETVTVYTSTEALLRRSLQLDQPMLAFGGTVRVPVVSTPSGWSYRDRPVKVGAPFFFETESGAMMGWILSMELSDQKVSVVQ